MADAELARRHMDDFARFVAPEHYVWNWHHALVHRKIDAFWKGTLKRVIIEMPPGHGKSEACSRNGPAFGHGILPDLRIIACSYTQDLAAEMNRDVQRIMDSDAYRQVFPGSRLGGENVRALSGKPRRNSDIFDIVDQHGRLRGFYKAAGVGVGITGRRFDRGIIDDPIKDRDEANSSAHRERVWRWFTGVFLRRQAKDAGILITSTRWHEDDLIGRIKRKVAAGEMEPFEVLTLPGLATDTRHPDDPRQPGEALWPWFRSAESFERAKLTEPRDFYALDQQDPRGEGSTEWGPECFPPSIWFDDWPRRDEILLLVIALDPSKGKNAKHGDYSALVALVLDRTGTLWIEADLARRPTTKIVADGIDFARRLQEETGATLEGFGVESDQFQELLADEFIRQTREQQIHLPIYKITTGGVQKEVRIRRLTPHLTAKTIRFRATVGTRLLVRQMEQFPSADHDDGPDAAEMARRLALKLLNGRKGK